MAADLNTLATHIAAKLGEELGHSIAFGELTLHADADKHQ